MRLHAKDQECRFCGALMYPEEAISGHGSEQHFGICCNGGKVLLPVLRPPPEPLASLMRQNMPHGRYLFEHMRHA